MQRELPSKQKSNGSKGLKKNSPLRVSVLCGGDSSERKISLRSGKAVYAALKRAGYKTRRVDPRDWSKTRRALRLTDVAFIALHGRGGEDGIIQKKLEKEGVPYIGSDAASSFRAFDKAVAKAIFHKEGIPTPPGLAAPTAGWEKKIQSLKLPLFVKPSQEGSSIGVYEIEDFSHAAEKIKSSLKAFGSVLVEEKIEGREFTVGVLGNQALPVVEMRPKRSFYDFRAKYTKGMTEYEVPARIPAKLAKKMQTLALKVHRALGLRDFSRVDFMADRQGRPYVLEANSIPGFTELSLLPKAAKVAGISFEELCSILVKFACQRGKVHGKEKKVIR